MLNKTPLAEQHQAMGGKMVDFGGWWMPVNYGSQMQEHKHVREAVGMFDVSHMTIIDVQGQDSKVFLRRLLANDVTKLQSEGKALYSGMLNEQGGVMDDLIVYLMPWGYRLVVNCATRQKDVSWIKQQAEGFDVQFSERDDLAMIAIQGPRSRETVGQVLESDRELINSLGHFHGVSLSDAREAWFMARTGYTGEEGFEVILPNDQASEFWQQLADVGVAPCGLGARDTLRLEAGMNLYGHEMDDDVSPLVANMAWTIAWTPDDRQFIGRAMLEQEKSRGISQKLVGLVLRSRGVLRAGYEVRLNGCDTPGVITSGTYSPSLQLSIALARVPNIAADKAEVLMRGKAVAVDVCPPCFVRAGKALIS